MLIDFGHFQKAFNFSKGFKSCASGYEALEFLVFGTFREKFQILAFVALGTFQRGGGVIEFLGCG